MSAKVDLEQRIIGIQHSLSAGERNLASVIFELNGRISGFTAGELSEKADVSPSTTARFFRRLGYGSYQEARTAARDAAAQGSPLAVYQSKRREEAGSEDFLSYIESEKRNLSQTYTEIPEDLFQASTRMIAHAGRVFVLGFRNSYAIAVYLRNQLSLMRESVELLPSPGEDVAADLMSLKPGDVLLAVGLRRRAAAFTRITNHVHASGGNLVLLTDASAPSWQEERVVTLRCITESLGVFDSYATPMCVLNYLLSVLQKNYGAELEQRFSMAESLRSKIYGSGNFQ